MAEQHRGVTLCITMGRRPALLTRTLKTLLAHNRFDDIVAVNDFNDAPTNAAYRALCPQGRLISPEQKLGHHGAVDAMYATVTTPYVFHCEDDWGFEPRPLLADCFALLDAAPDANSVCVRSVGDCRRIWNLSETRTTQAGLAYRVFNEQEVDWGGFAFNPNLQPLSLWREHGPWSRYPQEVHISRALKALGQTVVYATPGFCRHIGKSASVSRMTPLERWKRSFQKRWPDLFGQPDPKRQ